MSHLVTLPVLAFGVFAMMANGQQAKPDLTGNWKVNESKSSQGAGSQSLASIVIEQKGSSIHIVKITKHDGKEVKTELTCTTDGKDCDAGGGKASLWFDGQSLVEIDIEKETVTKSSMKLDDGGKALQIEIIHISPQADADTLVMQKS